MIVYIDKERIVSKVVSKEIEKRVDEGREEC